MLMTPEQMEKAYQFGCRRLEKAKKKKDYMDLKLLFTNLMGYKDAELLVEQCAKKIRKFKTKATLAAVFSLLLCAVAAVGTLGALYFLSPVSSYAYEENDDEEIIITGLKDNLLDTLMKKDTSKVIIPEEIMECSVVGIDALESETMEEVTLPESLASISAEAFADCPNLTAIYFEGTASQWLEIGGEAFAGSYSIEHEGDHEWTEWTIQEGYLCHEGGSQVRNCIVCSFEETEEVETREHDLVELPAVKATCTSTGLSTGWKCEYCGFDETPQEVIEMLAHKERTVAGKRATCSETGLTDGKKCSICDTILVEQTVIEMIDHTPVDVEAEEPTCSTEGHTAGLKCAVCNKILSAESVIEKLPHTEVELPAVEATCVQTGLTAGTKCSVCGEILVEQQVIEMTVHNEVVLAEVKATCTKTGLTAGRKCSVCGEVFEAQQTISKVAHKEEVVKGKAATCLATGLTDGKKCSVCGKVTVAQKEIAKTDHSFGAWKETKSATCTAFGVQERACTVCNTKETQQTELKNHTYKNGYCTVCNGKKTSEGLTFKKDGDTYIVTGIGTCTDEMIEIPNQYAGYPVTAIAGNAFKGNTKITGVSLPNSITSIGDNAFNGCVSLYDVTLSEKLKTIGASVFANCDDLQEIHIPNSVNTIGDYCFDRCYSLTDIYIGTGIRTSATDIFRYCEGIQQVYVKSLANYAVIGSPIYLYSPDAVLVIDDTASSEFVISSSLDQAYGLYKGCKTVDEVLFESGVTSIEGELFCNSTAYVVTIPRTVQKIGDRAFYNTDVEAVFFEGTVAQWNRITKGRNCFPSKTEIWCEDGDLVY